MNIFPSQSEIRLDDDVLWLDQRYDDLREPDLVLFRRMVQESLARGWAVLDARNYAYGRLMGAKLWSTGAAAR